MGPLSPFSSLKSLINLMIFFSRSAWIVTWRGNNSFKGCYASKNIQVTAVAIKMTDFENRLVRDSSRVNLGSVGKTVGLGSWKKV